MGYVCCDGGAAGRAAGDVCNLGGEGSEGEGKGRGGEEAVAERGGLSAVVEGGGVGWSLGREREYISEHASFFWTLQSSTSLKMFLPSVVTAVGDDKSVRDDQRWWTYVDGLLAKYCLFYGAVVQKFVPVEPG